MKVSLKILNFKKPPIVFLRNQPILLFNKQTETLLEALESKQIEIFSQCRSGFCGACKTQIISGEVTYIKQPLVSLNENECLPCCCIPDTNLNLDLSAQNIGICETPSNRVKRKVS